MDRFLPATAWQLVGSILLFLVAAVSFGWLSVSPVLIGVMAVIEAVLLWSGK